MIGSIRGAVRIPRRSLAAVAAAATLCLVAAGCDSSPYTASVNGQVIKEVAFDLIAASLLMVLAAPLIVVCAGLVLQRRGDALV